MLMFTGLVDDVGTVLERRTGAALTRFVIGCGYDVADLFVGASIACAGACHTVVDRGTGSEGAGAATLAASIGSFASWFSIESTRETRTCTSASLWDVRTRINLERALTLASPLGGHLVSGHVDATAPIIERNDVEGTARLSVRLPSGLSRYAAMKGSIALDGTSLTINGVVGDVIDILLIPHTLAVTTWGGRQAGDLLNVEVDLMARYAERLLGDGSSGCR